MDNECDECRRRGLNYSYDEDGEIEAINCVDCLYSDAPRRRRTTLKSNSLNMYLGGKRDG